MSISSLKTVCLFSGIDPLDIDTDKEVDYKPTNYTVSDKEVEFELKIDETDPLNRQIFCQEYDQTFFLNAG